MDRIEVNLSDDEKELSGMVLALILLYHGCKIIACTMEMSLYILLYDAANVQMWLYL